MNVNGRLDRLRQTLVESDALLVTSLTNIRYLTGFSGSAGMLFVLPGRAVLLTDGRYRTQAEEQLSSAGVEAEVAIAPTAAQQEQATGIAADVRTLGLE